MSKHRLVTAVAAGLLASVAQLANAADLELPYKAARVSTWTGCYGGLHVGLGAMQDTWTATADAFFGGKIAPSAASNSSSQWGAGFLAGVQGGCNYELGRFVVGLESEFWGSSLKAEKNFTDFVFASKISTANPWNFATSARAGVAFNDFLVYLKGGIVWGSFSYNQTTTSSTSTKTGSAINTGALLGLGLEYAFAPQWTAKVETDVIFFSAANVNIACAGNCVPGTNGFQTTISATQFLLKIGVNYRFSSDFSFNLD